MLEPTYEYGSIGQFYTILTVFNPEGCDTTYTKFVDVKPIKLFIPNVFTPGTGDSANEYFVITDDPDKQEKSTEALSKFYVTSKLVVFNRAGTTVFKSNNYNNKWNGDNLPDGVYYYVLECNGVKGTDIYKGSVTILRGN